MSNRVAGTNHCLPVSIKIRPQDKPRTSAIHWRPGRLNCLRSLCSIIEREGDGPSQFERKPLRMVEGEHTGCQNVKKVHIL